MVVIFATATVLTVLFYGLYAIITCNNQKNEVIKDQISRYGK